MSALQQAADFFAREAARYAGLRDAAEKFTTAAQLEAHVQGLQEKVDRLGKELDIEGLQAKAIELTTQVKELYARVDETSATLAKGAACHREWESKNAAHAEKAKTWNGEAERVLAKAKSDAAGIIAEARAQGVTQGNADAERIRAEAGTRAKTNADAYEQSRKQELSGIEGTIESAKKALAALERKVAAASSKHEEIKGNIAALKAKLD